MNIYLLRVICLIIGYAFGLIETGVLYGKIKGVDIRQYGSKNLGMTNALRVLGPKAGLVVFIGDFCKALIPCITANLIFRHIYPDTYLIYVMYVGLGVILGHNFPFYLKFKGGKGIAATGGAIAGLLNPWMIIVLLILFITVLFTTRYMSIASITLVSGYAVMFLILALSGALCFDPSDPSGKAVMIEAAILAFITAGLAIYKHKANIIRLKNHEENRFSFKKQVDTDNKDTAAESK